MKTSLEHLPLHKQDQVLEITEIIKSSVDAEKIMLYGSHATGNWVEHKTLSTSSVYEYTSDYDVLVVIPADDERREYELLEKLNSKVRYKNPINIMLHNIAFINQLRKDGMYLLEEIDNTGVMLYDAGRTPLVPFQPLSNEQKRINAQREFDHWFGKSKSFLAIAKLSASVDLEAATFVLHQSVEQAYHAVSLVFAGYKPKTHNLTKLKQETKRFSPDLWFVFPENTFEEKQLFNILKKSYIDPRYKKDFKITEEQFTQLVTRTAEMQALTETLCTDRIAAFN